MVLERSGTTASHEEGKERLLVEAAQNDPARFAQLYELNFERVYAYHGQYPPIPGAIFLYVPDAAASYKRALEAGASSLWAPSEMYGDLMSGVADPFGNDWYIATHLGNATQ